MHKFLFLPHRNFFFLFLFFFPFFSFSQDKGNISGVIRDASSFETLIGASVRVIDQESASVKSNDYGFYSISLEPGEYQLLVSYVGYKDSLVVVKVKEEFQLDLYLESGTTLHEVNITASSDRNQLETAVMGVDRLHAKEVESVPVIFGERDLLKTLQLLPGVLSAGEGNAGFFVRGGSSDQNLIILDEATVYNASHLFGFFSTFNSDAIKDVSLYKGGMPAQFGGRLSSVLDVNMLDGNKKAFHVKGGLGMIASRLSIEGPIKKEKGSFMLSGRRTYADAFLKLSKDSTINSSSLYFYDLNLKTNYQLDDKNTLYLSAYFGKDLLGYAETFNFDWGNATSTLRWNHVHNSRLFSNLSLIYSDFNYNVQVYEENSNFKITSLIKNFHIKQYFQYFMDGKNTFRFGVDALHQKITPASLNASSESQINSIPMEARRGADISLYASHDWNASDKLNLEYGLRINNFLSLGPGLFSNYDQEGNIESSEFVPKNKIAQWYFHFEPRLSLNFKVNKDNSLKFSFNKNVQSLHQLSNSTSTLPTDVWIMNSRNVKPQTAIQLALGYYRNLKQNQFEFSSEVYYKDMQNQIDFKDASEIHANPNLEADLLFGTGRAFGWELHLKKKKGAFRGWISYTLSKSERQFSGIDDGRWFPARQDQRNNLSLVGMYEINPRLSVSANFAFNTGNAVTFPSGKYFIDGRPVWYYSERNGYRMPHYHRLDLGLTLKSRLESKINSSWNFSLYNAYNHKNAYLIDFRQNKENPNKTEAYQVALFGIVPSVTWNFNF